jgi:prepilin-type N-terminal cleavage/methylation domain-containing protein
MRKHHHGTSLIELMVAIGVIALLATIAVPSYQRVVRKTHRTNAMATLLQLHVRQEKYRADKRGLCDQPDADRRTHQRRRNRRLQPVDRGFHRHQQYLARRCTQRRHAERGRAGRCQLRTAGDRPVGSAHAVRLLALNANSVP